MILLHSRSALHWFFRLVWLSSTGLADTQSSCENTPGHRPVLEVVGDSILFGQGLSDENKALNPDQAFPALISEGLNMEVAVQGWPGAMAGTIADRYPVIPEAPSVNRTYSPLCILVNVGANHRHHSARVYEREMDRLLDRIRETHPKVRIILLNFFRMHPNRLPILEKLPVKRQDSRMEVWDVRASLVGYTDLGIHPDQQSHQKLALFLIERIRKLDGGVDPGNDEQLPLEIEAGTP